MGSDCKRRSCSLWTMVVLVAAGLVIAGVVAVCVNRYLSTADKGLEYRLHELAAAVQAFDRADNPCDRDAAYLRAQSAVVGIGNLGRAGADAIPMLVDVMRAPDRLPGSRDFSLHAWTADSLLRIGEPALPAVIELLQDHDPFVRRLAMNNLAQWVPEPGQDPVISRSKLKAAVPSLMRAIKEESDPAMSELLRSTLFLIDPVEAKKHR